MNKAFYIRETLLSIKRYKLMSLKMFTLCFMCALMMTFTFSFGISLKNEMDEIIDKKMSLCQNTVMLDENTAEKITESLSEDYLLTGELIVGEFYGKSLDDFSIEYEDKSYKGVNDYTYDFSITDTIIEDMCSVNFNVDTISAESTLFSKSDSKELKSSPEFMGNIPEQEKEIMISDYYLKKFGINKNDIIGKNISVYYQNECIMKDYTVCGVIDSDIFYLHSKKNYSQIYISDKDSLNNLSAENKKLCIYSSDFLEAVQKRDKLISENYILEANDAVVLYSAIYSEQNMIIKAFGGLCVALFITTIIVLKGIIKSNIASRRKYFVMLTYMGVKQKSVKKLIFTGLLIRIVASAFVGSIAAYPLLIFTKNMMYYAVMQHITVNPLIVILNLVIVAILFLVITIFEAFNASALIDKRNTNVS